MDKSSVKVSIYGSEYVIKGDDNVDHILAIAEYVDHKMKEINKSGLIKSPLKVAILAALNIADEHFKSSAEQKKQIESFEKKSQKLVALLDQLETAEPLSESEEDGEKSTISLF